MDRKLKILTAIIEEYISTCEPVGSKVLAIRFENAISSATIRNEMAELAEKGYLEQPHTSAGRIPTAAAYRLYVDELFKETRDQFDHKIIDEIVANLSADHIAEQAGKALADMTGCAAIAFTTQIEGDYIACVQILRIGLRLYTLLLVTRSGRVRNRLLYTEGTITTQMAERFVNVANSLLGGRTTADLTPALIQTIGVGTGEYFVELTPFLAALYDMAGSGGERQIALHGEANLLSMPDFGSGQLVELLRFLSDRERLARLLEAVHDPLTVAIGKEIGLSPLTGSAMVTAGYGQGRIGVIGPMRLNYRNIIPQLEYFAKAVSKLLDKGMQDGANPESGKDPNTKNEDKPVA